MSLTHVLARGAGPAWALVAMLTAGVLPAAAVDEFHAFLLPESSEIEVDSLVTLHFVVDSTAQQFNAYEVTIEFDTTVVRFESVAQGALMTQTCSTLWFLDDDEAHRVTYTHTLLCAGVSLDGPGTLSSYTFRAVGPGVSAIRLVSDPDRTFLDDGLYVRPTHAFPRQVILHDASIEVTGGATGVAGAPAAGEAAAGEAAGGSIRAVEFHPNPTRAGGSVRFALPQAGAANVAIVDVAGRVVFERRFADLAPGAHEVAWDGTEAGGRPVAGGVYFAVLRSDRGRWSTRLVVIR